MVSQKEKDQKKIYNAKNRERINERQRLYRLNNPEKIKEQRKRFRENHREKLNEVNRKYYYENKEKLLADNKRYRQEHKDTINKRKKEYRKNNPHVMKNANKKWSENNPEKVLKRQMRYLTKIGKVHNLNYYDTKLALHVWGRAVKKRDNYTCQDCGSKEKLEADHIKPQLSYPELAFDVANGKTLCNQCHYKKHGKLLYTPKTSL